MSAIKYDEKMLILPFLRQHKSAFRHPPWHLDSIKVPLGTGFISGFAKICKKMAFFVAERLIFPAK
jgi:hypothetical protein